MIQYIVEQWGESKKLMSARVLSSEDSIMLAICHRTAQDFYLKIVSGVDIDSLTRWRLPSLLKY